MCAFKTVAINIAPIVAALLIAFPLMRNEVAVAV